MTTETTPRTRTNDTQQELSTCAQCHTLFQARKAGQYFCKASCRAAYQRETGLQGEVAGVTRLLRGVSVVIHFPDGPAAEKAIGLMKREMVSVVRTP